MISVSFGNFVLTTYPMCGRFSLTKEELEIEKRFQAKFYSNDLVKRYNVAPTQLALVITCEAPEKLQLFHWGLIPFWAKERSIGNKMINAKSETVREKPSFRNLIKKKRCLVISDGFYEWQSGTGKTKIPYRICVENCTLFAFAGLYDTWTDKETGELVHSFTILTTSANEKVAKVHDRMPVILNTADERKWLDQTSSEQDIDLLLKPFPDEKINLYQISTLVNSPKNDSPEILEPVF
ncbi:MAG TPA: SOS response-associated peptidase [Bacteroidia bacterium]|nr:SOS response-associated peptidase [Bacteroidia bacterium]